MNPEANPFQLLAQDDSASKLPKRKLSVSKTNQDDEFQLSKNERRKHMKLIKREKKRLMQRAQLQLQPTSLEKRGNLIKVKDFQNVILHLLADGPCPSWLHFQATAGIDRVLCIDIHSCPRELLCTLADQADSAHVPVDTPVSGPKIFHATVQRDADEENSDIPISTPFYESDLTGNELTSKSQQLPVVDWIGLNVLGPGDKWKSGFAWDEWTQVPLSQRQKNDMRRELESTKCSSFTDLLMTEEQLEHEHYPTVGEEGYFELPPKNESSKHLPIVAIDCEMCWTAHGLEVTRVSMVNDQLHTIYDELVKPLHPILDYNTQYSGITEELLRGAKKTLADVQTDLKRLLDRETIMIGQSLENDLRVLKLVHRRVIDTALIFHSSRGPPSKPSLRYLAQRHLNREIQGSSNGHDSVEDAKTCIELVRLKLEKGFAFGLVLKETETIFSRVKRSGKQACVVSRSHAQTEDVDWLRVSNAQLLAETTLTKLKETQLVMTQLHLREPKAVLQSNDCEEVLAVDDPENVKTDLVEETQVAEKTHQPVPHAEAQPSTPGKTHYEPETRSKQQQLDDFFNYLLPQVPPRTLVMMLAFFRSPSTQKLFKDRGEYMRLVTQLGAKQVHENHADLVFTEDKLSLLELGTRQARTGFGLLKMNE